MQGASKLPTIAQSLDSSRNTAFEPASVSHKVVLGLIYVADRLIAKDCSRTSYRIYEHQLTVATTKFVYFASQRRFSKIQKQVLKIPQTEKT